MSTTADHQGGILRSSAVMAVGTVFSRLSGFVRVTLLSAALGAQLHADVFNIANSIPTMLYILLAGGVFNAVLVPQLVRAMTHDEDGGTAYTNRVITLAALFLAGVSALLVIGAPVLMRLFLDGQYFTPGLAPQREAAIVFAQYCLPQVFFYGMFVLVGQVLNARGSFGPMMWAPIANNVVSVLVLVGYLMVYGHAVDVCAHPGFAGPDYQTTMGGFTGGQTLLLGLGSTVGIAVQLAVLVPYLRRAGFRYRPRFDFKGTGLSHTLRLGLWTVMFVVVTQVAMTVVTRLASSGTADDAIGCHATGDVTGYTVYLNAYGISLLPHGIATVSLATALLPALSGYAAQGRLADLGRSLAGTMRTAYAMIAPFALLLLVAAFDISDLLFGYGAASRSAALYTPTLQVFAVGLLAYTAHYLLLRGFYALERNRQAFFIQSAISAVNVALAWILVTHSTPALTAPLLATAYGVSYAVGAAVSFTILRRTVSGLGTGLVAYAGRLLLACLPATLLAAATQYGVHHALTGSPKLDALVSLAVTGLVFVVAYLVAARVLRLREVTEVVSLVTDRVPGLRGRL